MEYINYMVNSLTKVLDEIKTKKSLIMDFEFYQQEGPHENEQFLKEIAGKVFDESVSFYYPIFCPSTSDKQQLKFLKKTNLRYSEARTMTFAKKYSYYINTIETINPDVIVSWDNHTDLKILKEEEDRLGISRKNRLLTKYHKLDLARIVANEVFNGKRNLSLTAMGRLLNLKWMYPAHNALYDSLLIDKILQWYCFGGAYSDN